MEIEKKGFIKAILGLNAREAMEILDKECKIENKKNDCLHKYVTKIKSPLDPIKVKNYFDTSFDYLNNMDYSYMRYEVCLRLVYSYLLKKYPIYQNSKFKLPTLNMNDRNIGHPMRRISNLPYTII